MSDSRYVDGERRQRMVQVEAEGAEEEGEEGEEEKRRNSKITMVHHVLP